MEYIDYNEKSYVRSRQALVLEALFEHCVTILVSGAFLAKLLTTIGISDSLSGIITSVSSLAFLSQLCTLFINNKKANTKIAVGLTQTASIFLFGFIYIVPFISVNYDAKVIMTVIALFFAYILRQIFSPQWFEFRNKLIDPRKRASFSSTLVLVSLVFGTIIFGTLISAIMDKYEMSNNILGAFIFIAIASVILNILHLICILFVKNTDTEQTEKKPVCFKNACRNTILNKNFISILFMKCLYNFASSFSIGFISVYTIKELGMSLFLIQVITMLGTVVSIISTKPLGKYSDKTSYIKGIELGLILQLMAFVSIVLTTPKTWYMFIIHSILHAISISSLNHNMSNVLYSYVEKDYIAQAFTFANVIPGIVSFGAAILGGIMLDYIQNSGNVFMGINIYGQQVMAIISAIFIFASMLVSHCVIEKQKNLEK